VIVGNHLTSQLGSSLGAEGVRAKSDQVDRASAPPLLSIKIYLHTSPVQSNQSFSTVDRFTKRSRTGRKWGK
jgi:hypothetical protein